MPDIIARNAKAFVAALVTLVSSAVAFRFGFELPIGLQEVIISFLMSGITYVFTWLIPNR